MAVAVVQRKTGVDSAGTSGTVSAAFTSNITAGNAIVVIASMSDTTAVLFNKELLPPTDTRGNKYYLANNGGFDTAFGVGLEMWIAYNSTAGANTVSMTNNSNDAQISVYELSGAPYLSLDQVKAAVMASNATFSTGASPTTLFANEMIIAGFTSAAASGAFTAGAGYSNIQNIGGASNELGTEEKSISSTGAQTATATHAANTGVAALITVADTASSAAACRITLMGSLLNTTSGTHTVTATPAVGDLIVIIRTATGSTTSTAPTDNNSGGAGTYSLGKSVLRNTSADILEIWVRTALIASASSTVFTEAPGVTTGGGLQVFKVTNMTNVGAAAILQSASQANQAANAVPAPTFTNFPLATNPIFTAAANATGSGGFANFVGPVGHVNTALLGYATPTSTLRSTFAEGGVTAKAQTWTAQSPTVWGSIAIELDSSSSAPSVSITQVAATLTATGGTQAVATVNNVSIAQVAATLTVTGGTQTAQSRATVAQVAANLTATGGTQAVASTAFVSIAQLAATLTVTGGTQVALAAFQANIGQVAATLTATGGTQAVASSRKVALAQLAANLTATGGTQVVASARAIAIAQVKATLTVTGGTQVVASRTSVAIAQAAATLLVTGGTQLVILPPVFTPLGITLSSFTNQGDDSSDTNLADVGANDTIRTVDNPTNESDVASESRETIVSSETNQEIIEA